MCRVTYLEERFHSKTIRYIRHITPLYCVSTGPFTKKTVCSSREICEFYLSKRPPLKQHIDLPAKNADCIVIMYNYDVTKSLLKHFASWTVLVRKI